MSQVDLTNCLVELRDRKSDRVQQLRCQAFYGFGKPMIPLEKVPIAVDVALLPSLARNFFKYETSHSLDGHAPTVNAKRYAAYRMRQSPVIHAVVPGSSADVMTMRL